MAVGATVLTVATTTTPDGTIMAFEVTGEGDPLVLLHGITECRQVWDPLVPALAQEHAVVAVDLPGHGGSGRGGLDLASMAAAVAHVVTELDVGTPLVVGHSLGGTVASAYAAAHPTRGVVNVDQPMALAGFQDALRPLGPALRGDTESFRGAVSAVFDSMVGALAGEGRARVEALRRPDQDVVLAIWAPVLDAEPDVLDALVRSIGGHVTVPYLSLHGIDPGDGYGEWLAGVVDGAVVEVWPGLGHYPHLVEPDRFLERLATFSRSLP